MGALRFYRMADVRDAPVGDLQASEPEIRLGLTRAGVTGVQKAIRISHEGREKTFAAQLSCTVDLDPSQKGVHMSRFPELFSEAIDEVVIGEAFLVETLAEHIARHIVARQDALRAEVRIEAQYYLERRTPVTGLRTQEVTTLIGIAARRRRRCGASSASRRGASTRAPVRRGSCATLRRSACSRRVRRRGRRPDSRARPARDPQPARPRDAPRRHRVGDQRRAARRHRRAVDELADLRVAEAARRVFVVEHAHLQPRFVEDSVRHALKATLDHHPDLADGDFVYSRQVNLETIHRHDVVAERTGTVGELRRELAGETAAQHTELRDWLTV
jgi:Uncharacterized conserved protein